MTARFLAAFAGLCGVLAGEAGAQVMAADTSARVVPDVSRLRPAHRAYRLTILRGGLPSGAGERSVALTQATHAGLDAWAIVERRTVAAGTTVDSVVATRWELAPLHWEGTSGGARLAAAISRDTLYGAIVDASGRRHTLIVGAAPNAILSAAMLETIVPLLPLSAGWTTSLPMLGLSPAGGKLIPGQLVVEREESIEVPAGRFDCWVVALRTAGRTKQLWVSRDGRGVVRTEEPLPDVDGAILEQALLPSGPR